MHSRPVSSIILGSSALIHHPLKLHILLNFTIFIASNQRIDPIMEKWKKIQLIIGIFAAIGGLLIPIVIFIVSQQISKRQDEFNKEQKKSERVATLLSSLSSENERERRLALSYTDYLVQNDMFPEELFDVFLEIVRTGTPEEAAEAEKIITNFRQSTIQMQQMPEEQIKLIDQKIESIAPRVFIHINHEGQRQKAEEISWILAENQVNVPGIELLIYRMSGSEIRFFRVEDEEFAYHLAELIRESGLDCRVQHHAGSRNIRTRHFELWLGE